MTILEFLMPTIVVFLLLALVLLASFVHYFVKADGMKVLKDAWKKAGDEIAEENRQKQENN